MERRCHFCGVVLRKKARPQAIYCSESCRMKSAKYYAELAELPIEIRLFQLRVAKYAPEEAVSYRVGIDRAPGLFLFYPCSKEASPRWNGAESCRAYFRMCPFEPPVVPIAGIYGFQFFDKKGNQLETPASLAAGLRLVPLLDVALKGDQWKPSGKWFKAPPNRSGPRLRRLV